MVRESLFGPFISMAAAIPPDYPITPYANQLVFWQSKAYLLGTVWNDDQDFICGPIPIEFSETGAKMIE
jgi:hypothetical protein